jgi:hypothetical protein
MLSRGALVAHVDATKQELPRRGPLHAAAEKRVPNGVEITCGAAKAVTGEMGPPRRHGCIVVRATAIDPNASVGVAARRHAAPGACGYSLQVLPFYRVVDLERYAATTNAAYTSGICSYEFHASVAPLGQPNEVELRCADSILQVFVNGALVSACVDATFGFGGFGFRLESTTQQPARAIVHAVTLYAVA